MKKIVMLSIMLVCFFALSGLSSAGGWVPKSGKVVQRGAGAQDAPFKIVKMDKKYRSVTIEIPLMESNLDMLQSAGYGKITPVVSAFTWFHNGSTFVEIPQESYIRKTTVSGNKLIVVINFLNKGDGIFRVRIWGEFLGVDDESKKWLWINQKDAFCRNDKNGNPAYESLLNFSVLINPGVSKASSVITKAVSTVPKGYVTSQ